MPPKVNKIELELKKLRKLDGNKTCADCPEKMPSYAELTHNIFVCTKCAGIHRDFQYKVKGLSMSVFNETDVAMLASVGNTAFNSIYLANFNTTDHALPNGNDITKLKEFIRMKYMEKRWSSDNDVHNKTGYRTFSKGTIINKQSTLNSSFGLDLLSMENTRVSRPTTNNNSTSFDPFNNNSIVPIQYPGMSSFDAFNSYVPSTSSFDAFGQSSAIPASTRGFDAFNTPPPTAESFPQQNPTNGFSNFAVPQQSITPTLQTAPIKPATTNIMKPINPKNFSAFDHLLCPVQHPNPIVPLNQNNLYNLPDVNQSHTYLIYPPQQQSDYPSQQPSAIPSSNTFSIDAFNSSTPIVAYRYDFMDEYDTPDQSIILSNEFLDLIKSILIDQHPTIELHHSIIQKIEAYKISHTTKNMKQRPMKSSVVQELRSMLSIKENEIVELNNTIANYNIKEKEIKMNELNHIISCNMNKMEELESKIMMKNKEIMLLNTTISSNERENKQLSKTILSREYQINQLSQSVDDLKSMISNKGDAIDKLFTTIHNQNLINITNKKSKLNELSQTIEELRSMIVSKDEVINKLSSTASVVHSNLDLSDIKAGSFPDNETKLNELSRTIEELRTIITIKDEEINRLSSTIEKLSSSTDISTDSNIDNKVYNDVNIFTKILNHTEKETQIKQLSRTIEELRSMISSKDEVINKLSSTTTDVVSHSNIRIPSTTKDDKYQNIELTQTIQKLSSTTTVVNNSKDLSNIRIPSSTNAIEPQINCDSQINEMQELRSMISMQDSKISQILTLISNNNESPVLNNTTSLKNNNCNDDMVENYQLNNKVIVHSQQQQQNQVEILSEGKVKDIINII